MSRGDRKRALAAHKAAGTYVPRLKSRPCFYTTPEILENRRVELAAIQQRTAAQRDRLNDREWAFRPASAKREPASVIEGINVPVSGDAS